jgi:hypothetical protein
MSYTLINVIYIRTTGHLRDLMIIISPRASEVKQKKKKLYKM